jgi:hypothetical protein
MATNPHHNHIVLTEPAELLGGIPHLLGFHPVDALVVIGLGVDQDDTAYMALRANLPEPRDYPGLANQLLVPLAARSVTSVVLIIVGGTDTGHPEVLPYGGLLAECARRFADIGIGVCHQLWAAGTDAGATWRCYDDAECAGFVPDPRASVFGKAHVVDNVRVHRRREDIAANLAPVDDDVLARRADLLSAAACGPEKDVYSQISLAHRAISQAADGVLPESDEDIVALLVALYDHRVRDISVWQPDPVRAEAAEHLWTMLVRNAPAPERAEPASLLAFSAHQRGEGVLAGVALECAAAADPDHRLSEYLRGALTLAVPPARMRHAAERAAKAVRAELAAEVAEEQP